jgi:MFS family permease
MSFFRTLTKSGLRDILLISLFSSLCMGLLMPITPLYFDLVGMSPSMIGFAFTVMFVAVAIGEFFAGWFGDRIGMKKPILWGLLISGVSIFAFTLSQNFVILFVLSFFRGLGSVVVFPLARLYVGVSFPYEKKASYMGLLGITFVMGRTIGPLVGGLSGDFWGYDFVFQLTAIGYLIVAIFTFLFFKDFRNTETSVSDVDTDDRAENHQDKRLWDHYWPVLAQGLVAALFFLAVGVSFAFVPLFANEVLGLGSGDVGIFYTVSGIASMILIFPAGWLSDKVGRLSVMAVGFVVSAIAMIGIAISFNLLILLLSSVFLGASYAIFNPSSTARISDISSSSRHGTVMGFYGVMEDLGVIFGPLLGGLIWEAVSPQATFLFVAAICIPGIMANYCLKYSSTSNSK